jgi:hypothetical protein
LLSLAARLRQGKRELPVHLKRRELAARVQPTIRVVHRPVRRAWRIEPASGAIWEPILQRTIQRVKRTEPLRCAFQARNPRDLGDADPIREQHEPHKVYRTPDSGSLSRGRCELCQPCSQRAGSRHTVPIKRARYAHQAVISPSLSLLPPVHRPLDDCGGKCRPI